MIRTLGAALFLALGLAILTPAHADDGSWHTNILSYTFHVGEVNGSGPNDSQEISAYDPNWMENYGGCDGIRGSDGVCRLDSRDSSNGYFPTSMTPKQNPFYLDVPVSDPALKNRWVQIRGPGGTCFGQVEDAGPAVYHDRAYVFGTDDRRPANTIAQGGGMDVSPALNGCLGFNGRDGMVDWRFVDAPPRGPWTRIVTTSPASWPWH
ncbi:hypothetical protein [Mycobacterium sp. ITM-2016-00318]|uniref:hypothetical protein n=1 Tax=Mycobacterium sp. ITM-2016-00318 TaxID=2099693 RepID=UPI000CF89079|nr:hypothetical protein [Mycobacterium sp. ITM-2016-00318]WNG92960.1 hypothetical protein C6A82_000190 [Mycobacterium sp. ITM-2016-00318]